MLAENPEEVHLGAANLLKHLEIVRRHGVTPVVAINAFAEDFPSEHDAIREIAAGVGVRAAVCTHFVDGGKGAVELAEAIIEAAEEPSEFRMLYGTARACARRSRSSRRRSTERTAWTTCHSPPARLTPMSRPASERCRVHREDAPLDLFGPVPQGGADRWRLPVRGARANVGAGFVYLVSGDMRTMPGLSSSPAAERIDIDDDGNVVGLY